MDEYEEFLKQVPGLSSLANHERGRIAEALEEVSYPTDHLIVKEGDDGDTFFIVRTGTVVVSKLDDAGKDEEINRYKPGDYFGERSLINNEARAASIRCLGPVDCLCLNREAFSLLLGPLEDILKKRIETYDESKGTPSLALLFLIVFSCSSDFLVFVCVR